MIAKRASHLVANYHPLRDAHYICQEQPYHAKARPEGYINFGTAENFLMWDLIQPTLHSFEPPERAAHYDYLHGIKELREIVAAIYEARAAYPITAEDLVITSGTSAALDIVFYSLCEEGDGVLLATPYYPGFVADLALRAKVEIVPVHASLDKNFELSVEDYEKKFQEATANGVRVKALLLCSPHNPLGQVYSENTLQQLVDWCASKNIHLVADEIYAESVYGDAKFTSVSALAIPDVNLVHVIYGFAKDIGISGFKVGFLHSRNRELMQAATALCLGAPVSTLTQHALVRAIKNPDILSTIFDENRARLKEAATFVGARLKELGFWFHPADAGIFLWMDLRAFLTENSMEGELNLHQSILNDLRLNFSPGQLFGVREPGWFRFCFAQKPEVLEEGLTRLARLTGKP